MQGSSEAESPTGRDPSAQEAVSPPREVLSLAEACLPPNVPSGGYLLDISHRYEVFHLELLSAGGTIGLSVGLADHHLCRGTL